MRLRINAAAERRSGALSGSVDIGGTFTDVVLLGGDSTLRTRKVLSTPEDYARGVVEGALGLLDEAALRAGAAADVVVFDGDTLTERGTTFEPSRLAKGACQARDGLEAERVIQDGLLWTLRSLADAFVAADG